jgi:hypothetical protein
MTLYYPTLPPALNVLSLVTISMSMGSVCYHAPMLGLAKCNMNFSPFHLDCWIQTLIPAFRSRVRQQPLTYDAFTLDVKSVLNEILGGILGGTQC